MKIYELNTENGGAENPCELVSKYLMHEQDGGTLTSFLTDYDFESKDDVCKGVRHFIRSLVLDKYMRRKHLDEVNPYAAAVFTRYNRIYTDANKYDKYPVVLSAEVWHGSFARKRLNERTQELFSQIPDDSAFFSTCERLKKVYNLTDTDIDKLHFFVEQTKAGDAFPNSLRRMLYIWGVAKMTGKTTSATMLVTLLNGDDNEKNIARYSTTLANEMQIKSFSVPKIAECNVCLMDECFYADMGKTYADFKRFLTSSNGRAQVKFGQDIEWYGQPNYIATSNDSLQKFIKDWGDRRFLSIEFKGKPTEVLTFDEIRELWHSFVVNSRRVKDWHEWASELAPIAEEKGDRTECAEEIEVELRKHDMISHITMLDSPNDSPACPQNRITLKFFVDLFAQSMGVVEAKKRRGEIEKAVINVYGQRYSTTSYWLLPNLKKRATELLAKINNPDIPEEEIQVEEEDYEMPF